MARKKETLFPKQVKPAEEVYAERQEMLRRYEASYVFRKDMAYYPADTSLPWFDQVLDLEKRGKPTTPAEHDMAMEAKGRRGHAIPSREPGSDDE